MQEGQEPTHAHMHTHAHTHTHLLLPPSLLRCFKDSIAVFSGKGQAVWRQPLKVSFLGEAGMDSGGVTREWFSALSSSISCRSPDLFWNVVSACVCVCVRVCVSCS